MENLTTLQTFGQEQLTALKKLSKDPNVLRTIGFVALAATTGAVTGVIVAKGLLAAKGAVAAQAVLAAKGAAAAPSTAQTGAALLQQATANGATALQNANTLLANLTANSAAALNNTTGLVTGITTGGATLGHQLSLLFNALTNNALPLTAGAVSGGAVGVGVTQRQVRHLQVRFNEQVTQAEIYQAEAQRWQIALADAEAKISANEPKVALPVAQPTQDPLEQIRGIGPVFARHLNAAGIFTFADLAAQTPEQLQQIMGNARANRMFQPQEWIDQARQLAGAPDVKRPNRQTTPIAAPIAAPIATPMATITLDRLEAIAGLTPLYASRLNAVGILTYADLAAQTVERVQAIIQDPAVSETTLQDWQTAASTFRS